MYEALLSVLGKLFGWLARRPSKAQRELEDLKAEEEIARIRAGRRIKAKNAAFERAYEHGMRLYRENVERHEKRRWLLTDELRQANYGTEYAKEHWREFIDGE